MPRLVRPLLAAGGVTAALVVGGVLVLGGDDEPDAAPEPDVVLATPLAEYDTTTVGVARAAFCEELPAVAVERALAGEPDEGTAYADGERARVAPGVRDVVHEHGCVWTTADAEARAWVFAPPVTPERARDLVAAARAEKGCRVQRDAPDYGQVSVGLWCRDADATQVSFRGLFGDAWLSCSLSSAALVEDGAGADLARDELVERAGEWCVAVAQAASVTAG